MSRIKGPKESVVRLLVIKKESSIDAFPDTVRLVRDRVDVVDEDAVAVVVVDEDVVVVDYGYFVDGVIFHFEHVDVAFVDGLGDLLVHPLVSHISKNRGFHLFRNCL